MTKQDPIHLADQKVHSALLTAAEENDLIAADAAIRAGADVNFRGAEGRTPLLASTHGNHVEMARLLLAAGANPNVQDDILDSAFLFAGAEGLDEIVAAALEHGADFSVTNRYGGTALIPAAERAHNSTVKILIAAGAPLDHVNNLGWTALHEAIVLGTGGDEHLRVVTQLLEAGASPTLPDGKGVSPRALAEANGYASFVAEIDKFL